MATKQTHQARTLPPGAWKPKRRGPLYCSPACGGGCTWSAFEEANRKAKAMAAKLGAKWKPRVWENLGWHYAIRATFRDGSTAEVYPGERKGSQPWCSLHVAGKRGRQFHAHGRTPGAALMAVVAQLEQARDAAAAVLASIEL